MGKIKLLSLGLVVSFVAAIGAVTSASAVWSPNFHASEDSVVVASDATHEGSLYATGNQVTINGTVTGSLYCAGSTITINGTVEGDVLCAGQKISIYGTVGQDVRAAGQLIEVEGRIGGSLTAFGQDVRLGNDARVAGDINGAAQQFTLNGTVGRDVAVGTQLLSLNGEVGGNVDVATEQIQLGDQASVDGNLNYGSTNELSFDESKVGGAISYNPMSKGSHQSYDGAKFFSAASSLFLLMLAASAIVIALIMPRFLNRANRLFSRQMLLTALIGFATIFGGPIIVGLLLFSIILAPVGLALLFAWLVIVILSGIFFAYWVGSGLLRSQQNTLVRMLGGIIIVLVLYMIPFLNALTMLAALIIGSGMIIMTITNGYRRPSYQITDGRTNNRVIAKKVAS